MTIDELLAAARARLRRVGPERAAELLAAGAYLVDTRPGPQRAEEGEFAGFDGVLVIERNDLEWRLDPASDARIPQAVDHDVPWVIACSQGYSSSLAAASLLDLGLRNVTDMDGGFCAWRSAGLPVRRSAQPPRDTATPAPGHR